MRLSEFDFTVIFRKGKDNVVADALSRNPLNDAEDLEEEFIVCSLTINEVEREKKMYSHSFFDNNAVVAQEQDMILVWLKSVLVQPTEVNEKLLTNEKSLWWRKKYLFRIINNNIYLVHQIGEDEGTRFLYVVPQNKIDFVIHHLHTTVTNAHIGSTKTNRK